MLSFNAYGEDILLDNEYIFELPEEIQEFLDRGIEASRCSSPPVDYGVGLPPERTEQQKVLRSAWVNNIAARVRTYWRYQGAADDWACEVYVIQDRQGQVKAVDVRNCNVGDSDRAKSFMNSIERAVYKASPLPAAPDEAVFDSEIYMLFSVN